MSKQINSESPPMLLAVAPNGARKQYHDHSALPLSADELAATAVECLAAGATMMHVHVRDEANAYQHCLSAKKYSHAFAVIRDNVGEEMFLQATTESVGRYTPQQQMAMVKELAHIQHAAPTFGVSIAVREMLSDNVGDTIIADFFNFLRQQNILPQLILYSRADSLRLHDLLQRGVLPGLAYPCLFVLGRYSDNLQSCPAELVPFFAEMSGVSSWMGCAFGAREADVARAAALLGGHMRIGFENNELLADGRRALNNAELICQTSAALPTLQRSCASAAQAHAILTPRW